MRTEIIFLLDRSGSMVGLEQDTIGGFNAFINKQCQLEGETRVTTVLFDNHYELLWDGVDARSVMLTENEYFVRGSTALLDAIGKTIVDVNYRLSNAKLDEIPDNILFVITTDGLENSSMEYRYEKIQQMIRKQKENDGWEFIFLGANIDAAKEANHLGIEVEHAKSFVATSKGVGVMFDTLHEEISMRRKN